MLLSRSFMLNSYISFHHSISHIKSKYFKINSKSKCFATFHNFLSTLQTCNERWVQVKKRRVGVEKCETTAWCEKTSIKTFEKPIHRGECQPFTHTFFKARSALCKNWMSSIPEGPFINLDYTDGPVVEVTAGQKSFKLQLNVSAFPTPETQW